MTEELEESSLLVVEWCRGNFRKLGSVEFAKIGATPEHIAMGAVAAAVDLAELHAGDTATAIIWARGLLDMMELSLTTQETMQ